MNLKQAQAVLSDLLMKCEEENVALPQDPLESIIEAIQSLRAEIKHEMRRSQMDIALDHMKTKYGLRTGAPAHSIAKSPAVEKKRRHSGSGSEFAGHKPQDQQRYMRPINTQRVVDPPAASTHSPVKKKSRLKDEVSSKPAVRSENQKLVDGLFQLGEYELSTGRSQRGVTRLRAAKQVRDASEVITSGDQARKLEGVGASAAEKVDIMLREGLTGALKEYESGADDEVEEEGGSYREDSEGSAAKAAGQVSQSTTQKSSKSHATLSVDEEEEEEEEEEEAGDDDYQDEEDDNDDDYMPAANAKK